MSRIVTVLVSALAALSSQAVAQHASSPPLFAVVDVDRNTVPAGAPAAFAAAFKDAARNEAVQMRGGQSYIVVPLSLIPLSDTRVALVSTGVNACRDEGCSGLNAVHYLDHAKGRPRYPYTLAGEWLDVGASGTAGEPARRWGWSDAIADAPVLYTEGRGTWQGKSCGVAILTELAQSGPVEIARIPVFYSDGGAVETKATMLDGQIEAAERGRRFTVSYGGSRMFSETYIRGADGRYKLEGKSDVPSCR